jgi:hypothetical protein
MIPLSDQWVPVLLSQPETGMGYQIASVFYATAGASITSRSHRV